MIQAKPPATYSIAIEHRKTKAAFIREVQAASLSDARDKAIASVVCKCGGWPDDYKVRGSNRLA